MKKDLVETIDTLLTYKMLMDGKPNKEKNDNNHVRLLWGNKIYLDLEMYDNDFYLNVFLDKRNDVGYINIFEQIYNEANGNNRIEENTGYIRYVFNVERNVDNLNLFIKICGI